MNLIWIQHYPARSDRDDPGLGGHRANREMFSLVTFACDDGRLCQPRWTPLPRRAVEALVSDPL
jgi:hypothetical protein